MIRDEGVVRWAEQQVLCCALIMMLAIEANRHTWGGDALLGIERLPKN